MARRRKGVVHPQAARDRRKSGEEEEEGTAHPQAARNQPVAVWSLSLVFTDIRYEDVPVCHWNTHNSVPEAFPSTGRTLTGLRAWHSLFQLLTGAWTPAASLASAPPMHLEEAAAPRGPCLTSVEPLFSYPSVR